LNNCDLYEECHNFTIMVKKYNNFNNLSRTNDNYINKYKTNDNTLPKKKSKCPHCKKINENVYEVNYHNNCYNINNICSNCFLNWN
jgi:hypothetical protein